MEQIVDTGGYFSVAAPVEMQMGHGIPPIQTGARPRHPAEPQRRRRNEQPTDMFTQMRAAFALQRGLKNEEHLFHFEIPDPGLEKHRVSC